MKNKGYTMIELLAIIAILAIIALIATPIVIKTLNNARYQAFLDDAKTLNTSAQNYYLEQQVTKETIIPMLVTYQDQKATYCNNRPKLEYSGKNPTSGNIYIDQNGQIEIRIYDKTTKKCAIKNKNEKNPHLEDLTQDQCKLNNKTC